VQVPGARTGICKVTDSSWRLISFHEGKVILPCQHPLSSQYSLRVHGLATWSLKWTHAFNFHAGLQRSIHAWTQQGSSGRISAHRACLVSPLISPLRIIKYVSVIHSRNAARACSSMRPRRLCIMMTYVVYIYSIKNSFKWKLNGLIHIFNHGTCWIAHDSSSRLEWFSILLE